MHFVHVIPQQPQTFVQGWFNDGPASKEAIMQSPKGGGVAGFFVVYKLFISTRPGGALTILNSIKCSYGTVLEVNYLFHAQSARNYLFQTYSSPPPPGD